MATTEPETQPVPFVNEAEPGLGRRAALLEEQRRSSGGLSDDPADNPVKDDQPFTITGGVRRRGVR